MREEPKTHYHAFVLQKKDLEDYPCWYLDAAHSIPPWTPMFAWTWMHHQRYGDLWAADTMGLPACGGTDWREVDGCAYMCPILITEKSDRKIRAERFKKHLKPFVEDYDRIWSSVVNELTQTYSRFKAFDIAEAGNAALYDHFDQVFRFNYRVWALHSWIMYTLFAFYSLLEDICREHAGINDCSPLWHRLIRGFDNKMFEVDRHLWKLSMRAIELDLDSIIRNTQEKDSLNALSDSGAGRLWLNEKKGFNEFIREHGWRMPRTMELNKPSWIEDSSSLFSFIIQNFEKQQGFEVDLRRSEIIKEREQAETELLSRFPESQRQWIGRLIVLARKAGIFSEEHNYYFEHTSHALMRRAGLSCAGRMAEKGLVETHEDFVFLFPDEIRHNIISMHSNYRDLIEERKAHYESYSKRLDRPHLIGKLADDPQKAMEYMLSAKDYVMMKITVGGHSAVSSGLKADLKGNPAAPGLGQGMVRIISSERDILSIKAGDILVAVTTYSSWTPVYALINGVVLDSGASLSHASIVGREYNIPVVVQTKEATAKLKNGQQVRVDGSRGAVWIIGEQGALNG